MNAMSGLRRALLVVLVVAIAGGVLVAVVPRGPRAGKAAAATVRLGTPLLSVRRVPAALVGYRAETRLQAALQRVVAEPGLAPWTAEACLVVRVGTRTVYSRRPDQPLIPASALKLLTAEAAVEVLGAETRLATVVKADAAPAGGVVAGDLQVVGGGDPIIETDADAARARRQPVTRTRMEDVAQAIVAAGVRQVSGGVRADEGRYDTERARPGWKPSYQASGQVGPLSALLVDDGQDAAAKPVAQPALQFAQVLTDLLRALGVQVAGGPKVGPATGEATVATKESLPVRELVAQMVRESDNTTAELLTKEMGRVAGGAGTTEAGLAAAKAALGRKGLDVGPLGARDGSGLDRGDRATCSLLLAALVGAGRNSQLADGLPVAAVSGTLQPRFMGSSVAGRLRAKTGSLDEVSSLVGWVDPARSEAAKPVAFAVVVNGVPKSLDAARLSDRVGVALGAWPDAPPPEAVDPEPASPVP
jgi:D-alanyl-D-alanine carboxypeptidase/D-alanyl-D-alanine-endopeptidase (penicillin-binding protein 4)